MVVDCDTSRIVLSVLLLSISLIATLTQATHPRTAAAAASRPPNDNQLQQQQLGEPEKSYDAHNTEEFEQGVDSDPKTNVGLTDIEKRAMRNFLRFGRGEDSKRTSNRNFLRFGRGDDAFISSLYDPSRSTSSLEEEKEQRRSEEEDELSEKDKRKSRNFLRFGRGPNKNFLRFGRIPESNPMEFIHPLMMGVGENGGDYLEGENFDKRAPRNFLRFGRANDDSLLRMNRASNRNFLRFGRSTDSYDPPEAILPETKTALITSNPDHKGAQVILPLQTQTNGQEPSSTSRSKRSISLESSYIYPSSYWASESSDENDYEPSMHHPMTAGALQKKSQGNNFYRYGRDPIDMHFLRFGKRGGAGISPEDGAETELMQRLSRARGNKNFLRFG